MTIRLGDMLVGYGLISSAELDAALRHQQINGGRLGGIFVAMGLLRPDQLAAVLHAQRAVGHALPGVQRTLGKIEGSFGPQHPNTGRARYNLARLLLAAGRAAEALAHGEAALDHHRKSLGPAHEWSRDSARLVSDATTVLARIDTCQTRVPTGPDTAQVAVERRDGPALATLLEVSRRALGDAALPAMRRRKH